MLTLYFAPGEYLCLPSEGRPDPRNVIFENVKYKLHPKSLEVENGFKDSCDSRTGFTIVKGDSAAFQKNNMKQPSNLRLPKQDDGDNSSKARPTSHAGRSDWRTVFLFTRKPHLPILAFAVFLSVAMGLLQPAMAIVFGRYFQAFSDYASGQIDGPILMDKTVDSVYALLGIGFCKFVLKSGLFTSWLVFGEMQAKGVREQLFQALLDRDLAWYDERTMGVGTLLARLQTYDTSRSLPSTTNQGRQIRDLQLGVSQPLGLSVLNLVQAVSSLGLAFHTNWKLTLVVLSVVPVIALGVALLSGRAQTHVERHNERLTHATKVAIRILDNVVTVKLFNTQKQEGQQYGTAVQEAAASSLKQAFFSATQVAFARFAGTIMFVQGKYAEVLALQIVSHECIVVLQRAHASAGTLQAVLNKVDTGRSAEPKVHGLPPRFCDGTIEMRAVSFAYPVRPDHLVLHDCSFSFPAGQTTFIVGRSGSGKSTIGQLLLKFYEAQSGTISIDGIDLRDIETNWIRNNISLVQQQTTLFSETIFRNIALGHHDHHLVANSQVSNCVKMANLQSTIEALPDGVNTRVGRGGSSLSGGQKQRIAIARVRLRDTPVLILDEATSALDATSRIAVMGEIRRWRRNQTTIIITHDLSQIQEQDMVYVIENGRVIRNGRRNEIENVDQGPEAGADQFQQNTDVGRISAGTDLPLKHRRNAFKPDGADSSSTVRFPRRDSIDDAMEIVTEDETSSSRRFTISSGPLTRRLMKGLSATTGAALKDLKRQSLARAKAMYVFGGDQLRVEPLDSDAPPVPANRHINAHAAAFLSVPRTPAYQSKPLPVPPLILELSSRDESFKDATTRRLAAVAEQEQKRYSISMILATVWPVLNQSDRVRLVCGVIATLCHAGAPATFSYALVQVFGTYSLPTGYQEKALMYSMVVLGVAVADGIASFLMHYLLGCVSQRWVDDLRMAAMELVLRQPKAWFGEEQNSTAILVSCLDRSAEEMIDLVGRFAAQLVVVAVMMMAAVLWSFITCWKMTLVSLAVTPLLYFITRSFESISSRWEARTNDAWERIGDIYAETFADIKTVRALTLESYFHKKYHHATTEAFSVGKRRAVVSGLFFGLSDSAIIFFTPLIFWYGARLAKNQEWPAKSILTVFSLLLFCTANASAVVTYIPEISSAHDTAKRLLRLVRTPVVSHEDVVGVKLNQDDPTVLFGPIHFINLTFSYSTTEPDYTSREIHGHCGCFRVRQINNRFPHPWPLSSKHRRYGFLSPADPSGGPPSLTLAGRDIRSLDPTTLRSLISMVPQSPVLLPTTVRENIIYGLPPDSLFISASRIESAAQSAGIHQFIQSLPQGYATIIGDGGLGVSGGQAQRIVIARALVRNPRILILDEATSALDGESAEIIRSSIKTLVTRTQQKMTVVVVTHAKEMMAFVDHVVVLDQGSVVEQGPFKDLLSRRAALWRMLTAERPDNE
ncbi:hypothetical protein A1O1_09053 [Capronia coronata CBS 617.96]|uniref:ATPase n=1 Tax=Capronia coronata CBS 617.96 TaxID=1182541 RepID=W9XDU5_9EURO|nr:uncharacterized protein A1O1_09053 [Capronia coronata CBS 617.96]EXJ78652.1 hypothetical protein A1O1_09053 [Capronia coronata CBS 617.96]